MPQSPHRVSPATSRAEHPSSCDGCAEPPNPYPSPRQVFDSAQVENGVGIMGPAGVNPARVCVAGSGLGAGWGGEGNGQHLLRARCIPVRISCGYGNCSSSRVARHRRAVGAPARRAFCEGFFYGGGPETRFLNSTPSLAKRARSCGTSGEGGVVARAGCV